MMTDPDTLRALAKELCEAKEGSRELDADIAKRGLGWLPKTISWKAPNDEWGQFRGLPSFSTSLDAALPGEDIVIMHAPGHHGGAGGTQGQFHAVQEVDAPACVVRGYGHTEPLARRAAALLAMAERKEREG